VSLLEELDQRGSNEYNDMNWLKITYFIPLTNMLDTLQPMRINVQRNRRLLHLHQDPTSPQIAGGIFPMQRDSRLRILECGWEFTQFLVACCTVVEQLYRSRTPNCAVEEVNGLPVLATLVQRSPLVL